MPPGRPGGSRGGAAGVGREETAGRGASGGDRLPSSVRHVLTGMGLNPNAAGPPGGGAAARERWESLAAIAQLADDLHARSPDATLSNFSAELTERAEL